MKSMIHVTRRYVIIFGLAAAGLVWNGDIWPTSHGGLVATAEAVIGAPVTPVSYAGVPRRSTVGAGAPGVGAAPGAGVGAPGVGTEPANRGGAVNRVGVR
jgi:hypothetical protein